MKRYVFLTQRYGIDRHQQAIESLEVSYMSYIQSFGLTGIPVSSLLNPVDHLFETVRPSGVVLTGGGDPNDAVRNAGEDRILSYCIRFRIPVFGICRGMQSINRYFGGSLQKISDSDPRHLHPCPGEHTVRLTDSRLPSKSVSVNSYHQFGIRPEGLGNGLTVFAEFPPLKLAEGICHRTQPIAGVMWHPERMKQTVSVNRVLMNAFVRRTLFWSSQERS